MIFPDPPEYDFRSWIGKEINVYGVAVHSGIIVICHLNPQGLLVVQEEIEKYIETIELVIKKILIIYFECFVEFIFDRIILKGQGNSIMIYELYRFVCIV